jgi:hypothetical protein
MIPFWRVPSLFSSLFVKNVMNVIWSLDSRKQAPLDFVDVGY